MAGRRTIAPFPWFGGKAQVAPQVWRFFGDVVNYVEPFAGSLAVLLERPAHHTRTIETVNDKDSLLANFWRSVQADPEVVARAADWPVNEADLHARHLRIVERLEDGFAEWLMGDVGHHDAELAGWWVWGISQWIGGGFASGDGPWAKGDDGRLTKANGKGITRKLPHLGDPGKGINRQRPPLGDPGMGVLGWMQELAERLRSVRVVCGDWRRVVTTGALNYGTTVGLFLDPPYAHDERALLYNFDCSSVFDECAAWAFENGGDERLRIILCGYDDRETPPGWRTVCWRAVGGHMKPGSRGEANRDRERMWLSPGCLEEPRQADLFDEGAP